MYKPGQGMTSRIGILILVVLFGFYASYSWYGWRYDETDISGMGGYWAIGGVVALLAIALVAGIMITMVSPRSSDFLIDMDLELRKVNWPQTKPFSTKSEAWGATVVVIITVVILATFIYIVDRILTFTVQESFLPWLFG